MCTALRAQTKISGTVIDAATNEAIIGANILETGTSNGVITNLDGEFTIVLSDPKAGISITMIGYKPLTVEKPRPTGTYSCLLYTSPSPRDCS